MKWIKNKIEQLKIYASKPWFPVVLSFVAFIYHFFLVMPVDTLFVTSSLIAPRRTLIFIFATTLGFTLGGTTFAILVSHYGPSILEHVIPGIMTNPVWAKSEIWMNHYGPLALGGISIIPFTLHPLVAIAGLHHMPFFMIAISLFVGRFLKYSVIGWFCVYLPAKIPFIKIEKSAP